ncbi:MAG: radical SAM protein [Clostridia bacterium]|nr:radical SAM protein [Clostridia bacterium]
MGKCAMCPRKCLADRSLSPGRCGATDRAAVAKVMLHHWEEPVLSGNEKDGHGSGAVFFSGCPLHCVFCQNRDISGRAAGKEYDPDELSALFLSLQERGAYNLNLVSPTQYSSQIREALLLSRDRLSIPVVWNTGGYESVPTLRSLEGLVDVYLTDFKYGSERTGRLYASAPDYAAVAEEALREMVRQTGKPVYGPFGDEDTVRQDGPALKRGVIVRHLILPGESSDSEAVLGILSRAVPPEEIVLSLMSQYTPDFVDPETETKNLLRRVTSMEAERVRKAALRLGFSGFSQDRAAARRDYTPDFRPWEMESGV